MMTTITEKRCTVCGQTKAVAEFYKCKTWKDGLQQRCKPCHAIAVAKYERTPKGKATRRKCVENQLRNPKRKAYNKAWKQSAIGKASNLRYLKSPVGMATQRRHRLRDIANGKLAARSAMNNAIRRKSMPRAKTLKCRDCGKHASGYHHYKGYAREHHLDVVPLCTPCHVIADRAQ